MPHSSNIQRDVEFTNNQKDFSNAASTQLNIFLAHTNTNNMSNNLKKSFDKIKTNRPFCFVLIITCFTKIKKNYLEIIENSFDTIGYVANTHQIKDMHIDISKIAITGTRKDVKAFNCNFEIPQKYDYHVTTHTLPTISLTTTFIKQIESIFNNLYQTFFSRDHITKPFSREEELDILASLFDKTEP